MNILLLGWNRLTKRKKKGNWQHELFRRELARQHSVKFFGIGYEGYDPKLSVSDVLKDYSKTDIVLVHYEFHDSALAPGLEKVTNVLKVHICGGDYDKSSYVSYDRHFNKVNYDVIFPRYSLQARRLKKRGIGGKHFLLPWSVDISKCYKQNVKKTIDVLAAFQVNQLVHPNRYKINKVLHRMRDVNSVIGKFWFENYVRKINESRIFVTSNVNEGELCGKYSEVMACGTLLLTTKPEDLSRLGYINKHHLVVYKNDFSDLERKIRYLLKHGDEREYIAKKGMEFVRKNHNHTVRVKEFTDIVEKEL